MTELTVLHRAIHEAGHAVVGALHLGWVPDLLRIHGDDQRVDFVVPDGRGGRHNTALMLVGGPVALTVMGLSVEESVSDGFGSPGVDGSDYDQLVSLGYDPFDTGLWSDAAAALREHYGAVRAIAAAALSTPSRELDVGELAEVLWTR